jgi:hypothetical protein
MIQKRIEIDAQSILRLLTHYTQDLDKPVPLDCELVAAGVSPYISRWIMLEVTSDEWGRAALPINPDTREPEFYHVRYEGRKVGSWMANGSEEHPKMEWKDTVEAPV